MENAMWENETSFEHQFPNFSFQDKAVLPGVEVIEHWARIWALILPDPRSGRCMFVRGKMVNRRMHICSVSEAEHGYSGYRD